MDVNIEESLVEILNQFETLPFLFVGSGLSRRYIDLDTWEGMLTKYSNVLGKPFSLYRSASNGDLSRAGELLANDFHDYWFTIKKADEISQNDQNLISRSSPLKIEISNDLRERSTKIKNDDKIKEELNLLKHSTIDGIITTNYDMLLESLLPDFKIYIGQEELLNSTPQMIAEIYKIHGSCTLPNSLVLTYEDYQKFEEKNPYLIAKLLTIFIEHPVIFIGYSLNDRNIRKILDSIVSCLNSENLNKMEKQLIFIEWDREGKGNKIYRDYSTSDGHSIPITVIKTDDFSSVYRSLCSLERNIPPQMYRLFKERLYEIVATNDPEEKLEVNLLGIDDEERLKKARFVIGFGRDPSVGSIGYDIVTTKHLFQNLIFDDLNCDPMEVIIKTIPRVMRSNAKYVPIFKFLREAHILLDDGTVLNKNLEPRIIELIQEISNNEHYFEISAYQCKREEIRKTYESIEELKKTFGPEKVIYYLPLVEKDKIKLNEIETFLKDQFDLYENHSPASRRSFYRNIACFYDWLKFGVKITSVTTEEIL